MDVFAGARADRDTVAWTIDMIEVGSLPGTALGAYVYGAIDEALLDVPCFCWLLRDADHVVLVDSGPDAAQSVDVGYEVAGRPRDALLAALRVCDVAPADVELVVHTHLHQDHVQNDELFPAATVLVQRRELDAALAGDAACARLSDLERAALAAGPYARSQAAGVWYRGIASSVAGLGERLQTVDGECSILPGLVLVPSGGHTAGHQSVVATTRDGDVCLCGDIVSLAINRDVVGPMTPDEPATRAFLKRSRSERWEVVPAHEPDLRSHPWLVRS
jgi:glyoxylase-like metal-dependent hydrolase (beta-lactamase superfamily II)